MLMLQRILVAVDFGETSMRALERGRQLADCSGAALHLVHVLGYPVGEPESTDPARADACARLEALLDEADRLKRRATTACLLGSVAPALARYATDHEIDLVVMGTHRHGPSFQMARGSVAESVLGLAPCAVLAVKRPADAHAGVPIDPPPPAPPNLP
jgi:nucleotide-binding universal stress UspA family protein